MTDRVDPGAHIQPKGMTAYCRCAVRNAEISSDLQLWSPRSDFEPDDPSDYESKRICPADAIQAGSACSPQPARLLSAVLTVALRQEE
jgi:hypothetical protein